MLSLSISRQHIHRVSNGGVFVCLAPSTLPHTIAAALFFDQLDGADGHAWVDGLEHVVQRQQPHGHRRHRFHFYPGLACGAATAVDDKTR